MPPSLPLRLRQLQVVHRHGDRTPLRNVFKGNALAELEECKRWTPKLPLSEQLTQLGSTYRVKKVEGVHDPFQTRPFGYLTTTGIGQMTARGDSLVSCLYACTPVYALICFNSLTWFH